MTNAEKYLKEGVDSEKFIMQFAKFLIERKVRYNDEAVSNMRYELTNFFNEKAQPTLTEDERVILRNIGTKMWNTILRENGEITFAYKLSRGYRSLGRCEWFSHLFQFIKERRRI